MTLVVRFYLFMVLTLVLSAPTAFGYIRLTQPLVKWAEGYSQFGSPLVYSLGMLLGIGFLGLICLWSWFASRWIMKGN